MSHKLAYLHLLAAPQLKISGAGTVVRLGKQTGICVGWIPVGGEEQEHLLPKGRKFTLFVVKAEMAERKRRNGSNSPKTLSPLSPPPQQVSCFF